MKWMVELLPEFKTLGFIVGQGPVLYGGVQMVHMVLMVLMALMVLILGQKRMALKAVKQILMVKRLNMDMTVQVV